MKHFLLSIFLLCLLSCSESGEDLRTACGVVVKGKLQNPVSSEDGIWVTVTNVISESRVTVRDSDGEATLVQLQGVKDVSEDDANSGAIEFLKSLDNEAYFFRAEDNCTNKKDNIRLIPGAIVTQGELSYAEELISNGFGEPDTKDSCSSNLVRNCYAALAAEGQ